MSTPPLTPDQRAYYGLHWQHLRIASRKAADAAKLWRQRNAELMDLARRSGWDQLTTANNKLVNLGLKDAASTHAFWTTETERISALLAGELAARQLLYADTTSTTAEAPQRPTLVPPTTAPTMAKVG